MRIKQQEAIGDVDTITGKRADAFADNTIEVLRPLSDRFKTLT